MQQKNDITDANILMRSFANDFDVINTVPCQYFSEGLLRRLQRHVMIAYNHVTHIDYSAYFNYFGGGSARKRSYQDLKAMRKGQLANTKSRRLEQNFMLRASQRIKCPMTIVYIRVMCELFSLDTFSMGFLGWSFLRGAHV